MCAYTMDSFCHKEKQSYTVFWGRDATGAHIKQNKPDSERQMPCAFSNMWNPDLATTKITLESRRGTV